MLLNTFLLYRASYPVVTDAVKSRISFIVAIISFNKALTGLYCLSSNSRTCSWVSNVVTVSSSHSIRIVVSRLPWQEIASMKNTFRSSIKKRPSSNLYGVRLSAFECTSPYVRCVAAKRNLLEDACSCSTESIDCTALTPAVENCSNY